MSASLPSKEDNLNYNLISPYLNFDPALLVNDPNEQYIFAEGQPSRARFDRAFSEIGALTVGGAALGGVRGFIRSGQDPTFSELTTWVQRRTHVLNHTVKNGTALAQTGGTIALMYGIIDFSLQKLRNGADDEINTLIATTGTGLLYRSVGLIQPGGWLRCAKGGAFGGLVGLTVIAFTSWDSFVSKLGLK